MKYILFFLYLITAYLTYYRSAKYKSNPYLWLALGICLPYAGYLLSLVHFRKREKTEPRPSRVLPGYRSKKPWKMALSTVIYTVVIYAVGSAVFGNANNINIIGISREDIKLYTLSREQKRDVISTSAGLSGTAGEDSNGRKIGAQEGKLQVHFIDVGQADSILIKMPNGKVMLVDAGNNADGGKVTSYIKKLGIKRIDVLVGTHPHEDHIGGMDDVIKSFGLGSVYMPKVESNTKSFFDVMNALKAKGLKVSTAVSGVNIDLDRDVKVLMLAPNGTYYESLNNYSAVIKLTYGAVSFMLEGDAEAVSEYEMLSKGYDLRADVLKLGHHGSSSSTTADFLDRVNPKYAVIMTGKDNDYGHPHKETMEKLKYRGIAVYRTDENGTVIAETDGSSITFNTNPGSYSYGNKD